MKPVFDFIAANWQLIASIVALILTIIIALIRKKPRNELISYVKAKLVDFVPQAINAVEVPGNGDIKKHLVINSCLNLVVELYGRILTEDETNFYTALISGMIEKILSTPQKKGE